MTPDNAKATYVIVDVDGTLADHTGVRSPYDESKVHLDNPYPVIVKWVQEISRHHKVIIVSGRKESCKLSTIYWLIEHDVPFNYILMRGDKDNRPDEIVKKEILDQILRKVPKENIAFVIDDRPRVIEMWRKEGLRVIPARGAIEPF